MYVHSSVSVFYVHGIYVHGTIDTSVVHTVHGWLIRHVTYRDVHWLSAAVL